MQAISLSTSDLGGNITTSSYQDFIVNAISQQYPAVNGLYPNTK